MDEKINCDGEIKMWFFYEASTKVEISANLLTATPASPLSPFLPLLPRLPGGPGGPESIQEQTIVRCWNGKVQIASTLIHLRVLYGFHHLNWFQWVGWVCAQCRATVATVIIHQFRQEAALHRYMGIGYNNNMPHTKKTKSLKLDQQQKQQNSQLETQSYNIMVPCG